MSNMQYAGTLHLKPLDTFQTLNPSQQSISTLVLT